MGDGEFLMRVEHPDSNDIPLVYAVSFQGVITCHHQGMSELYGFVHFLIDEFEHMSAPVLFMR